MKTIPLLAKILSTSLIIIPGVLLMFNLTSAQTSDRIESKDVRKKMKEPAGTEKRKIIGKIAVDRVQHTIERVTPALSLNEKSIEVTLVRGRRKKHTSMIHNRGDSPLEWKVSLKGETQVLYRLHDRSQECSMSDNSDDADQTIDESSSFASDDLMAGEFSSKTGQSRVLTSDRLLKGRSPIKQTRSAAFPADFDDDENSHFFTEKVAESTILHSKVSERADPTNPMQIFEQWFHFAECGYATFEPKVDVMEVSADDGQRWKQILPIDGQSYVVNAKCFNPVEFLEALRPNREDPLLTDITTLDDFLAEQGSNGFMMQPRSGIIPPKDSAQVTLTFDSGILVNGDHDSHFILKSNGSNQTEIVVPVKLTVISEPTEGENESPLIVESGDTEENQIPDDFAFFQNYPNPFNPTTNIKYSIPSAGRISIKVFDIRGKEVATLVNEFKNPGEYVVGFDGSKLSNGVYFYRIESGSFMETKKMILMK